MKKVGYTLCEVIKQSEIKEFINFPKRLYRNEKRWIAPMDHSIEKVFSPTHNSLFDGGEAIRWIVRDEHGVVVGRIAAFYNREKAQLESQPTGGCGFFECIDSQEVATILFDAARDWLRERGMEAMDGPINFGQRDSWWGLLVEGFEYEPLYENPYNFAYYKDLFENYGFCNYFNQNSYRFVVGANETNPRLDERAERLLQDPAYTVRHINMSELEQATEDFRHIYNRVWSQFSGVKEMTREESRAIMSSLRPIIDPNLICFAYYDGRPIGFFVLVPDLNCVLKSFNGRFGWWQKLQLLWQLRVCKSCDRVFGMIFGVDAAYHGKGVESAIICKLREYALSGRNGYSSFEFAWIGDFNPVMNRMITQYVCAEKHKMHTTYRYLFDRTKSFERCPRLAIKKLAKE